VLGSSFIGSVALVAFIGWELRSTHPMLDIRLFRNRGFASVNVTAMLFSFGMFGSIFFLTQFLQTVQGLSPLAAGIRVLPWTAMPMLLAPVVGMLAERWGGKPLVVTGLALQAIGLTWLALLITPTTPYVDMVAPFVISGMGMTLFFVPLASLVLGRCPPSLEGLPPVPTAPSVSWVVFWASPCWARLRQPRRLQLGSGLRDGMTPAVYVGAAVVALGAVIAALIIPGRRRVAGRPSDAQTAPRSRSAQPAAVARRSLRRVPQPATGPPPLCHGRRRPVRSGLAPLPRVPWWPLSPV
jgi:hypothetical protein